MARWTAFFIVQSGTGCGSTWSRFPRKVDTSVGRFDAPPTVCVEGNSNDYSRANLNVAWRSTTGSSIIFSWRHGAGDAHGSFCRAKVVPLLWPFALSSSRVLDGPEAKRPACDLLSYPGQTRLFDAEEVERHEASGSTLNLSLNDGHVVFIQENNDLRGDGTVLCAGARRCQDFAMPHGAIEELQSVRSRRNRVDYPSVLDWRRTGQTRCTAPQRTVNIALEARSRGHWSKDHRS